jgi:Tfp pilus assembly protein PilF
LTVVAEVVTLQRHIAVTVTITIKMNRRAFYLIVCLLCAAAQTACVTAPVQEMSDARQAINAAVDAGADRLAPDDLAAARRYLEDAERKLKVRSFASARSDALLAKTKAVAALEASYAADAPDN